MSSSKTDRGSVSVVTKSDWLRTPAMILQPDSNLDLPAEVQAELKEYLEANPQSPSAIRKPRLMRRGRTWIALLGSTLEEGIAGMGDTVRAALRAFDVQYRNSPKPRP